VHKKLVTIIDNEVFRSQILEWVRTSKECKDGVAGSDFLKHCNEELLPKFDNTAAGWREKIGETTSLRWLRRCGLVEDNKQKGVFYDGHERHDVICMRIKFLAEFAKVQSRMAHFESDIMMQPVLPPGVSKVVWVTHDESVFNAGAIFILKMHGLLFNIYYIFIWELGETVQRDATHDASAKQATEGGLGNISDAFEAVLATRTN
jgi:hypothetical protein